MSGNNSNIERKEGLDFNFRRDVQGKVQHGIGVAVDLAKSPFGSLKDDVHGALPFTDTETVKRLAESDKEISVGGTQMKLKDLELELRAGNKQQIYTRVESWILDQNNQTGSPARQSGEAIKFDLWKVDREQANRDIRKICTQFPEFAVAIGSLDIGKMPAAGATVKDSDLTNPDENITDLLADKLMNRMAARQQYKTQLDHEAKEIGGDTIGEYTKNFGKQFEKWGHEGGVGAMKQIGAVALGVLILKGLWEGGGALAKGAFGSENFLIQAAATAGGAFAIWKGYEAVTDKLGTPDRTADSPNFDREAGPGGSSLTDLEKMLATNEGIQSVMFSFRAPTAAVLEMYRDRHSTMGTKPFSQYFAGEGAPYNRRAKEMLKIIDKNPQMQERMYRFVDGVVQTFADSPNYKAQLEATPGKQTFTILDFLDKEYVKKYRKDGERSEFFEVIEDAMEIERGKSKKELPNPKLQAEEKIIEPK